MNSKKCKKIRKFLVAHGPKDLPKCNYIQNTTTGAVLLGDCQHKLYKQLKQLRS